MFVADNKLLVGTKQGFLLYYTVEPNFDKDQKYNVELIRYNKNFSKKPIQQIAVLPDHELVIRLSDGIITLHDLSNANFTLIKAINKTKGATLFTLDIQVRSITLLTWFFQVTVMLKKLCVQKLSEPFCVCEELVEQEL